MVVSGEVTLLELNKTTTVMQEWCRVIGPNFTFAVAYKPSHATSVRKIISPLEDPKIMLWKEQIAKGTHRSMEDLRAIADDLKLRVLAYNAGLDVVLASIATESSVRSILFGGIAV